MDNIINTNKEELHRKKKIIITIGCNPPETDNYIIDNKNFELRVLCLLKSKHIPRRPGNSKEFPDLQKNCICIFS